MSSKSKQSDTKLELKTSAKEIEAPDFHTEAKNTNILEKTPGDRQNQEFESSVTQTETGTMADDIDDPKSDNWSQILQRPEARRYCCFSKG